MKFKIDILKFQIAILVALFVINPPSTQADQKQWNVSKDTVDVYNTIVTNNIDTIRVQFPNDIESQNTKISVIRDLPEIPLSFTSSAGSDTKAKFLNLVDNKRCIQLGLDNNCGLSANLNDYSLSPGDTLEIKVEFVMAVDGKSQTFNKTAQFTRLRIGTFRLGVGALFVLSNSDNFYTRPEADDHQVYSSPGDDLSLNLAATVTWVPYKQLKNSWSFGPTLGVGTDADNLSVFLGYSGIFKRAWTLTGGIAAVKENKLNSQYEVGQIVPEPIDSSALTTMAYKARFFIGLTWSPTSK